MHRTKYEAKRWYRDIKLKKLADESGGFPCGAYQLSDGRYKRLYRTRRSTHLKHAAARRSRRRKSYEYSRAKSFYKKEYDFWWEYI